MADNIHEKVRKLLAKDYVGYVLVTCKPPSVKGDMNVEMSFDGDPFLAAFLMEGAQEYLDEKGEEAMENSIALEHQVKPGACS